MTPNIHNILLVDAWQEINSLANGYLLDNQGLTPPPPEI
jgi:hypothetical protein